MEEYYNFLKSNAAGAKSPIKRVTKQIDHLVMSMIVVFKLQCLKIRHYLNHFPLRVKVFIKTNLAAMSELRKIMLCVISVIIKSGFLCILLFRKYLRKATSKTARQSYAISYFNSATWSNFYYCFI